MKALVAVTCIAMLAAVGYYFWSEYSKARTVAQTQELRAASEAASSEKLKNDDYKKCRQSINSSGLGEAKKLRDWCRKNEFIIYSEQLDAEAGTAPN